MTKKKNPLAILGLNSEVVRALSDARISDLYKATYRQLALFYHPDRNAGDKNAADRFREVQEAYESLEDDQAFQEAKRAFLKRKESPNILAEEVARARKAREGMQSTMLAFWQAFAGQLADFHSPHNPLPKDLLSIFSLPTSCRILLVPELNKQLLYMMQVTEETQQRNAERGRRGPTFFSSEVQKQQYVGDRQELVIQEGCLTLYQCQLFPWQGERPQEAPGADSPWTHASFKRKGSYWLRAQHGKMLQGCLIGSLWCEDEVEAWRELTPRGYVRALLPGTVGPEHYESIDQGFGWQAFRNVVVGMLPIITSGRVLVNLNNRGDSPYFQLLGTVRAIEIM
jgi:hypothetical protein